MTQPKLTDREREILNLLSDGLTPLRIARQLSISKHTVRAHIRSVRVKAGVDGPLFRLVAWWLRSDTSRA